MDATDQIVINGLEFYGYHGASDQEQSVGHRYFVDVKLSVDTSAAGRSDRLSDTVSYSRVARRLIEIGTQRQFRLLEALAAQMADVILEEFPLVQAVHLRVQKMCPPMNAIVASVGVEVTRSRQLPDDRQAVSESS
jgi:dihydroneopterin aldolase